VADEEKRLWQVLRLITGKGFEEMDAERFDSTDNASPVVDDITISIVLTYFIVMAGL
jgi:hypothetical protein